MITVRSWLVLGATAVVAAVILAAIMLVMPRQNAAPDVNPEDRDPSIADLLAEIDEDEIYSTVNALQNFTSRHYGQSGNAEASQYLFDRLDAIPGLEVEYQGGDLRNVIATLPGRDSAPSSIYMVGAHYDSVSEDGAAPGATDNGGGVAIVLELARVMSGHAFNDTIKFALWNAEDGGAGVLGSAVYAEAAAADGLNISLYYNFDSACYDPNDRYILDIMHNDRSRWVSDMMTEHNTLYGIGFKLNYNAHDCTSDHRPFWDNGYTAVMTHSESHGSAHTSGDTVDQVSTSYAKMNAQLGLSVIARLAGMA